MDAKTIQAIEAVLAKGDRVDSCEEWRQDHTYQTGRGKRNPPRLGGGSGALVTSRAGVCLFVILRVLILNLSY